MIESSIVLYDEDVVTVDVGGPVSVEFDFEKIWNFFKAKKSEGSWNPKKLRFYHVHPEGLLDYSMTDLNCVKGFKMALGSCQNFNIVTFNSSDLSDLTHNRICFDYSPYSTYAVDKWGMLTNESHRLNNLEREQLYLLKALSYGHVNLRDRPTLLKETL